MSRFLRDPISVFIGGIAACMTLSAILAGKTCSASNLPASSTAALLTVQNQLTPKSLVALLAGSVRTFVEFPPLGVVLVAVIGVSVAQKSGCLGALMRSLIASSPGRYLTPVIVLLGLLSRTGAVSGYVIVPAFAAVAFASAGRHPIAGLSVAFAAVSASIGANILPAAVDPVLQVFTQRAAQQVLSTYSVSPLCNYFFSLGSACLTIIVCWYVTDRIVEPWLWRVAPCAKGALVDESLPAKELSVTERKALHKAIAGVLLLLLLLGVSLYFWNSIWRDPAHALTDAAAPLMQSLVPLIFLVFLLPGVLYGFASGSFTSHRDIFSAMIDGVSDMRSFVVLCFFASILTKVISESNLGTFAAGRSAAVIEYLALPKALSITGVFLCISLLNLLVPSASAKWAIVAPLFVPFMMRIGETPEATQALYRVATASTSTISPFLPYLPVLLTVASRFTGEANSHAILMRCMIRFVVVLAVVWYLWFGLWLWLGIPLGVR